MPLPTAADPVAARGLFVDDLRRHLVGPAAEDEALGEPPFDGYHTGYLSPAGESGGSAMPLDAGEDDQNPDEDDEDTGGGEGILTLANVAQQAAMGMTFQVAEGTVAVELVVTWGEYKPPADIKVEAVWKRAPVSKILSLAMKSTGGRPQRLHDETGVRVYAIIRPGEGTWVVTVSVVNERSPEHGRDTENRIYQVGLKVREPGGAAVFRPRPPAPHLVNSTEVWNFELLYRDRPQFAVGHGCATDWTRSDRPDAATAVWTEWIPATEVFKASAGVLGNSAALELDRLADASKRDEVCASLRGLCAKYQEWIDARHGEMPAVLDRFPASSRDRVKAAALVNLSACQEACDRMGRGVDLLEKDALAWKAFHLMNEAVARSMRQAAVAKKEKPGTPRWRAFQIAFILVSAPSALDPKHAERTLLDLIWFPTGGGKTEAYLGLSALCMFHRRLSGATPREKGGTVVLSRYTLRLLTIQQLERAARVVMACELVRRDRMRGEHKDLTDQPFEVGLFVGKGATPNKLDEARLMLADASEEAGTGTTLPIPSCPWCRTRLDRKLQRVDPSRLVTPCPKKDCEFAAGLPVAVVDEHIYNHPPAMVIGTVDKLAMMAWRPQMKAVFGRGATPAPPPSLIIQDELHLISDSLGTIVALYETAIDHMCTVDGAPPKLVGSTATIRRAEHQCKDLFNRTAKQFPPSGTLATDSFFYAEDTSQPGRLYVGVHAQGRSPKHSYAWLVGTLTQTAVPERIPDPKVRDAFYTLVSYFNSMRELGGALVLTADDVPAYTTRLARLQQVPRRELIQVAELSSQLRAEQIRDRLAEMETPIPGVTAATDAGEPLDVLLCTNMISVGVDVDRLGLMVVVGQPKTTAEYIQASSRVGRPTGAAGLVVTLYNWTRPRDRSHYERFVGYHRCFYRHVESTSVTPFSARARDRALHAVLVSMTRQLMPAFDGNKTARDIRDPKVRAAVEALAAVIVARAAAVDPDEEDDTRAHLDELIEEWATEAVYRELIWQKMPDDRKTTALLRSPGRENDVHGKWSTPMSMRDVDPAAPVKLLTQQELAARKGK